MISETQAVSAATLADATLLELDAGGSFEAWGFRFRAETTTRPAGATRALATG